MCFDYKSSVGAWLLASGISIYMLANPQTYYNWIPLLILTFAQIQILEAILWVNNNNNSNINEFITTLIPFFLLLQPLVNSYVGYKNTNEDLLYYLTLVFVFVILYYILIAKQSSYNTTVGPNNHLVWNRYDQNNNKVPLLGNNIVIVLYLVGIFVPLFFIPDLTLRYVIITYALITFVYSMYNYLNTDEMGSMWCYLAVGIAVLALVFNRK